MHQKAIKEKGLDLLNEESVLNLSKEYSKTPGQIVLNWHIHLGIIPIPGTTNPKRMKENLEAESFTMKDEDYNSISALCEKKEYRFCDSLGIYGIDIFA